jgi:RNA polymerase sigma-70 factor (ECF subfamily)
MPTEMTSSAQQDESAVAAVRGGDAERYRELVERHERRVYAVAWSRLGDAALAEEVTQEAFIRAYRRLWLLGDGAKFAGWVNTIARRVAINLGLRHRRELNKRKRWALENPGNSTAEKSADETDPLCTPETLRQTLAELPAAHRECLVLFYLEGKSGAEAAAALGISEAALRVRLHRARAAMRERLEEKLEGSLAKLRPAKTLVPSIMAAVLASSSAKVATAGGTGAAILGALAKFAPFKWLFTFIPWVIIPLLFFSLIMQLPAALLFHGWRLENEQQNYRDPKGFRTNLHQQFDASILGFFAFLIGMIFVFIPTMTHLLTFKDAFLILAFFTLLGMGFAARQLEINCSRFQIWGLLLNLFMSGFYFCLGLGWLPINAWMAVIVLFLFFTLFTDRSHPLRMDYNLFLRATQEMLPPADRLAQKESSLRFGRAGLRAFARFLGERRLATNFRWGKDGLILFLPAVKSPFVTTWNSILPSVRNNSNITLGWDGSVAACCGKKDAADLETLKNNSASNLTSLQNQVAMAVSQAWRNFREGKIAFAERAIGQIPNAEIFIVPPGRTRANRWRIAWISGILILNVIVQAHSFLVWYSGLKPVLVPEAEIRRALKELDHPVSVDSQVVNDDLHDVRYVLFVCEVFPPTNLFTPEAWAATRQEVLKEEERYAPKQLPAGMSRARLFIQDRNCAKTFANGWLTETEIGFTRDDLRQFIKQLPPEQTKFLLGLNESRVAGSGHTVLYMDTLAWTIPCLKRLDCLDLVDGRATVETLLRQQVLSATMPTGWRQDVDPKLLRGTFLNVGGDPIQDTWQALVILDAFGALDRVDREACINGILRFHHGKGLFGPVGEHHNPIGFFNETRHTFWAFESLRMLNALDRVKDLNRWQFRSEWTSTPDKDGALPKVKWSEIEAWVCQQRLEKILRERKENPQSPVRSLLDP